MLDDKIVGGFAVKGFVDIVKPLCGETSVNGVHHCNFFVNNEV